MSGLIAAKSDNSLGAVGVAPNVKLVPIIIYWSLAYQGFQRAILENVDVINCSWGWNGDVFGTNAAIANDIHKCNVLGRNGLGIVILCAAGNFVYGNSIFPANHDDVIGVIASTPDDSKKTYGDPWDPYSSTSIYGWNSNYGSKFDFAAPGTHMISADFQGITGYNAGYYVTGQWKWSFDICTSSYLDSDYSYSDGTSSATAITSGVVALILDINPAWSAQSVYQILKFTAEKIGVDLAGDPYDYTAVANGRSLEMGWGRINAYEAVLYAFDPNNKIINTLGCGPQHYIESHDTLAYTINFQNIGQAPAQLVIIRDTLDNDLDISTLTLLDSKHNYTFQILNGNIAEWTFDPIFLPDSSVDQEDSKGYVKFSILPLQNLTPGKIITNKSGIIFDQNVPVITNEVFNTISISPLPVASILQGDQSICQGETTIFTASQGDGYIWNNGHAAQTITVNPDSASIYKVMVFYKNSCPSSAMAALSVNPNVSNFKVKRQCNSDKYDFTYTSDLQNISFFWDFGLDATPSTSTVSNPTGVTFSSPGTKQITLTINGVVSSCTTTTKTLDVLDLSCGKNKVMVCHIESGKPEQTICLNTNALSTHLAHGDCIGPCNTNLLARMSKQLDSQQIVSLIILPTNPIESDTIKLITQVYTYAQGELFNHSLDINGNKIIVNNCYFNGIIQMPKFITDTFNIGVLPNGINSLNFVANFTSNPFDTLCDSLSFTDSLNFTFTVGTNSFIDEEFSNTLADINIYPNPFKETTNINFVLSKSDYVKIEVYNYMWQKVLTLYDNFVETGKVHHINFKTKGLGQGMYFTVLTTGMERKIVKMLITK